MTSSQKMPKSILKSSAASRRAAEGATKTKTNSSSSKSRSVSFSEISHKTSSKKKSRKVSVSGESSNGAIPLLLDPKVYKQDHVTSSSNDTNALILPSKSSKNKKKSSSDATTKQKRKPASLSKKETRKLRQLMKKKKMLAERKQLLETLDQEKLSREELSLMNPVDHRKTSRKQLMEQVEMKLARGLKVDENDPDVKKVIGRIQQKYATKIEDIKWEEVFPEKRGPEPQEESEAALPQEEDSEEPTLTKNQTPSEAHADSSSHDLMEQDSDSESSAENDDESIAASAVSQKQPKLDSSAKSSTTTNAAPTKPLIMLDFGSSFTSSQKKPQSEDGLPDDASSDESGMDDDMNMSTRKVKDSAMEDDSSVDASSGSEEESVFESENNPIRIMQQRNLTRKRKRKEDTKATSKTVASENFIRQPLKKRSRKDWSNDVSEQFSSMMEKIQNSVHDETLKDSLLSMMEKTKSIVFEKQTSSPDSPSRASSSGHLQSNSRTGMNPLPPQVPRVIDDIRRKTSDRIESLNEYLDQESGTNAPSSTSTVTSGNKKFFVPVNRDPKIQEARIKLPVCGEEQQVMEKILENDVVIICGETGSGKTTQVPQFLYEYGFGDERSGYPGLIGVTQPRRVAAISTAKRVAEELNTPFGGKVSYHVRYDNNLSEDTTIKFMTDGVLLKEIQSDILLSQYSCLLLDEAHERNVNTDILIGMLSRVIPERNRRAREGECMPNGTPITPLKLVIMSATLRVDDFTKNTLLFPPGRVPTVINVQSRQFPVHVHFSKHTEYFDYVGAVVKKTKKIHEKLPPGGILIFLTGKQEIDHCVKKLRDYSSQLEQKLENQITEDNANVKDNEEELINDFGNLSSDDEQEGVIDSDDEEFDRSIPIFDSTNTNADDEQKDAQMDSSEEGASTTLFKDNIKDQNLKQEGDQTIQKLNQSKKVTKLHVLPLYSMLHPKEQLKVFQPPPSKEHRLCVVATNVAETSLTIPGIRYVIDPGRVKEREFDDTGVSRMVVQWTSQAGANQRAGRAGRTGPGHAYRLYSSAVYQHKFKPFFDPEIVKVPIDNIVLQMKSMAINNIENFPLPTPPDPEALKKAVRNLIHLQALKLRGHSQLSDEYLDTKITSLGTKMANYPLDPRYSKMIIMAKKTNVLPHIIGIVSALTVEYLFMHSFRLADLQHKYQNEHGKKVHQKKVKMTPEDAALKKQFLKSKKLFADAFSDHLSLLKAMGAYQHGGANDEFCGQHHLHAKNMREAHKLARQLTSIVQKQDKNQKLKLHSKTKVVKMNPPSQVEEVQIRQILCAAYVDQVACKVITSEDLANLNNIEQMGKLTEKNRPYTTLTLGPNVPVYIHPSSYLSGINPKYVVYSELVQNQKGRYYMKGVCAVEDSWLCAYGGSLINYSKPLQTPAPVYNNKKDRLDCYRQPFYGESKEWKLPCKTDQYPHQKDKDLEKYFSWFAALFIQGKIFTDLPNRQEMLHSSKELRQGHIVSKKAIAMVDALKALCRANQVAVPSKKLLRKTWKKDKSFLLREYLGFVQKNYREQVAQNVWPPKE